MTLEEIKKKYSGEMNERSRKIAEAERKRDLQQSIVNYLKAEQEKLRPLSGVMDNESRKQFNHLTFRINEEKQKLHDLEIKCDETKSNIDMNRVMDLIKHQ